MYLSSQFECKLKILEFWSLKIDKITVQNQILSVKHLKEIFFEQFPKKLFVFSTQKINTAKKYGISKLISLLLFFLLPNL